MEKYDYEFDEPVNTGADSPSFNWDGEFLSGHTEDLQTAVFRDPDALRNGPVIKYFLDNFAYTQTNYRPKFEGDRLKAGWEVVKAFLVSGYGILMSEGKEVSEKEEVSGFRMFERTEKKMFSRDIVDLEMQINRLAAQAKIIMEQKSLLTNNRKALLQQLAEGGQAQFYDNAKLVLMSKGAVYFSPNGQPIAASEMTPQLARRHCIQRRSGKRVFYIHPVSGEISHSEVVPQSGIFEDVSEVVLQDGIVLSKEDILEKINELGLDSEMFEHPGQAAGQFGEDGEFIPVLEDDAVRDNWKTESAEELENSHKSTLKNENPEA